MRKLIYAKCLIGDRATNTQHTTSESNITESLSADSRIAKQKQRQDTKDTRTKIKQYYYYYTRNVPLKRKKITEEKTTRKVKSPSDHPQNENL